MSKINSITCQQQDCTNEYSSLSKFVSHLYIRHGVKKFWVEFTKIQPKSQTVTNLNTQNNETSLDGQQFTNISVDEIGNSIHFPENMNDLTESVSIICESPSDNFLDIICENFIIKMKSKPTTTQPMINAALDICE